MGAIQDTIEKVLEGLPHQMMADLIRQKLAMQGVKLSAPELELMVKEVFDGGKNQLFLKREELQPGPTVTLNFGTQDIEEIDRKISRLCEGGLREVVEKIITEMSVLLLATLKEKWATESHLQRDETSHFRERLFLRWQEPLEGLSMLLTISRELGSDICQHGSKSGSETNRKYLAEVLSRLHARACQITAEVICLLEGGFADGAMARWRTLHEIAVVAAFIADHGEDLAERYVLHQAIEARRAADEYQRCQVLFGNDALEEKALQALQASYDAAILRFGREFKENYGWASHHLNLAKPNFVDIQRAVGNDYLRPYYRMATHNVHANPKGIFFQLGNLAEPGVLLAGPSNAGLAEAGHKVALSLAHISASIATLEPSLDSSMILQVITRLMIEVSDLFEEVEKRLDEDTALTES